MASTKPSIEDLKAAADAAAATYAEAVKAEREAAQAEAYATIGTHVQAVSDAVANRDAAAVATTTHELSQFVRAQFGTARRASTSTGNGNGGTRPGGLRDLVLETLNTSPSTEYTGAEMGKVLGRSSGACANALEKLAEMGEAVQTSDKPRRFRKA